MSQAWIFIFQISSLVHIHKESTPINVWSERYFQGDHLTYFLHSKLEGWGKKLPLHPSKANYYRATFYLTHLIVYSLILIDEKSLISGVTNMSCPLTSHILPSCLSLSCSHDDWIWACQLWKPKHSHRKLISTMLIRIKSSGSSFLWAFLKEV